MNYVFPVTLGHGVVNVGDLPIPFDMVLNASALVVLITFVYLKVSWKESIIAHREEIFDDKQSLFGKLFGFLILILPSLGDSKFDFSAEELATPPTWKVLIVNCVPGSPIDCAAIIPTASPVLTGSPFARSLP